MQKVSKKILKNIKKIIVKILQFISSLKIIEYKLLYISNLSCFTINLENNKNYKINYVSCKIKPFIWLLCKTNLGELCRCELMIL